MPANYDDNQLFCGGLSHQLSQGYRCGVCGDPWDGERENEAGGKYATGQISRGYHQGSNITVTVQITANHMGFFEFKVCPVNDPEVRATQQCLDQYPLNMADGSGVRFPITSAMGAATVNIPVTLPVELVCTQCVLQWRYHAGNNWGTDPEDGRQCVGCGPQEEFYGCADIQIVPPGESIPRTILDDQDETNNNVLRGIRVFLESNNNLVNSGSVHSRGTGSERLENSNTQSTNFNGVGSNFGNAGHSGTSSGNPDRSGIVSGLASISGPSSTNGEYIICQGVRNDLNEWCQLNCQRNNCPASHCSCTPGQYQHPNAQPSGCRGAGIYADFPGYNTWCNNNCARGFCPNTICVCL